jgi:hypothetical protein
VARRLIHELEDGVRQRTVANVNELELLRLSSPGDAHE